jgi:hypothetical protein
MNTLGGDWETEQFKAKKQTGKVKNTGGDSV